MIVHINALVNKGIQKTKLFKVEILIHFFTTFLLEDTTKALMAQGGSNMRTNLAERLGYEPEEETKERQERLMEELRYREAMRRVAKTCCVWLGGAAFVLAVIAGYAEMTDACVATGAIALGLTTYGIL